MARQLRTLALRLLAGANVGTILLLLLVGYSDHIHPDHHPLLATTGLLFPLFLLANGAFLLFWLLAKRRYALLPVAGFLLAFVPTRTYSPLNLPRSAPKDAIKVLSYNVWLFAGWEVNDSTASPILDYICQSGADIVCLQEATACEIGQERIDAALNPVYAYHDTLAISPSADVVAVYTRYPIVGKERVPIVSKGNICGAFRLKVGADTVLVLNAHLETTGLSYKEKETFGHIVRGDLTADSASHSSRRLADKLGRASRRRASQAEVVADYVRRHKGTPVILCGDFNDGPISYTHHTIACELTDCYVATGNGPGFSYHASHLAVRIDNIMCSNHFVPYECRVDRSIDTSDHYPMTCRLKMRRNLKK